MGREDFEKKEVLGPIWSKVFLKYAQMAFCLNDGSLRSFKISEISLVRIL